MWSCPCVCLGSRRGCTQNDITDAVLWAVAQGIADKERVAITGISFGGFCTLAGITFTPGRFVQARNSCMHIYISRGRRRHMHCGKQLLNGAGTVLAELYKCAAELVAPAQMFTVTTTIVPYWYVDVDGVGNEHVTNSRQ